MQYNNNTGWVKGDERLDEEEQEDEAAFFF